MRVIGSISDLRISIELGRGQFGKDQAVVEGEQGEGALSIAVDAVAAVLLAEVLVRDYEEGEDTLLGLQYY
jgi:hypothetical protein